jgi:hypothetical protein
MVESVPSWSQCIEHPQFSVVVQDRYTDSTVLLVSSAGRIGTWVLCSSAGDAKITLGPREDRIAPLLAKRAYALMVKDREIVMRSRGMSGAAASKRSLLLGIGLPELKNMELEAQIELVKLVETLLEEQVFCKAKNIDLTHRMQDLEI